jgi:hypothetical protein
MPRSQAIHHLRDNKAERSPRRLIVLDTETRWTDDGSYQRHDLRLWVTRCIERDSKVGITTRSILDSGDTAAELADHVDAVCTEGATSWLFAHNLGFDLIVTRLVLLLIDRGWQLGKHALTLDAPWLQMSNGRRRLTMADTFSWLPTSVDRLGHDLGVAKPPLPGNDANTVDWLLRCAADVDITAEAITQLLDWWDRNKLGCWSLTGAATGWNAYRHHRYQAPVVIDPEPAGRAFERRAINAGRREVWRVGVQPKARYIELDLERAHLTAARHLWLPSKRSKAFGPIGLDDYRLHAAHFAPIAEVTVTTETPRYPLVAGRRTWYPVGTFRTILCGPEIAEAMARGELVAVHRGIMYRRGPTMTIWAQWIADILDGRIEDAPPMAVLAAKAWSRRVPGKWATRTTTTLATIEGAGSGWSLERGIHHPSEQRCALLTVAGTTEMLLQDQDSDDCFPAVLAWIQSATRVAVSRLIDHFGPERMVSCNTDGIIVRAARTPNLDKLAAICAPFKPRLKGVYHHVDVISPQHMLLDGVSRLSGVPRAALDDGERKYAWQTWPSFTRQLEHGDGASYVREPRRVDLGAVPVNRWVLTDGSTRPPRAAQNGSEAPAWVHPYSDASWPVGARLRPLQHPQLAAVVPGLLVA